MRCAEVGDVVGGEEKQGDDEEGDCVKGRFLGEGVVEIMHTKWSLSEGVCARKR